MFSSKIVITIVVFIVLVLVRELWHLGMMFYNVRQVRSVLMEGWYQWSIHGRRLSLMKRLGVVYSVLSLYEEYGISILPGLGVPTPEAISKAFGPEGLTKEDIDQISEMYFRHISEIRNEEEAVAV